jgi:hypothetical protein
MTDAQAEDAISAEIVQSSTIDSKSLIAVGILTFLLIFSFFALSLGSESNPLQTDEKESSSDEWRAFSVVAPIDTGINVYHEHFRTNETYPDWLLDGLGVNKVCELTFEGTWQERYDADKASCWDTLVASDIVYFPGTKIIGSSPDGDSDILILDDPSDGHGSAVTGAVLDANPNAVIFFVEGFSTEAVLAAANQPLVDIISTSFGAPGSLPVPGIERGTEVAVVEQGKMHAGAADNSPSPAIQDATAGPPWSMTRKKSCPGLTPTFQQTGLKFFQTTMTSKDTMRHLELHSQRLGPQEFCRLFWNHSGPSSMMTVLVLLQQCGMECW